MQNPGSVNAADALTEHAKTRSTHPAIEVGGRVITYGELLPRVNGVAANLRDAGVEARDVVGVMLPDGPDLLVLPYALGRLGRFR